MMDYAIQTVESTGATVAFGILLLLLFAVTMFAILFALLLVRAVWRWLTYNTWNDVIVRTEHHALRETGRANVSR